MSTWMHDQGMVLKRENPNQAYNNKKTYEQRKKKKKATQKAYKKVKT